MGTESGGGSNVEEAATRVGCDRAGPSFVAGDCRDEVV